MVKQQMHILETKDACYLCCGCRFAGGWEFWSSDGLGFYPCWLDVELLLCERIAASASMSMFAFERETEELLLFYLREQGCE